MKRRLVRGVMANSLGQVINVASQLLLVPLFVTSWGTQLYGEWLTLSAAVSYVLLMDFGMQRFVVNRMTQCYACEDRTEFRRVFQSGLLWSVLTAGGAALVLLPAVCLLPLGDWFRFSTTDQTTVKVVLALLGFQILGSLPQGIIGGVYRSVREFPRSAGIDNLYRLGVVFATVAVLLLGGGLVAMASVHALVLVLLTAGICLDLRRRHPEARLGFGHADYRRAITFLGPGAFFFLLQVAAALSVQGTTLMVGASLGAGAVAAFAALRTLSNAAAQATLSLHTAMVPELTALEAQGRYADLRGLQRLMTKATLVIILCAALFLHFMGRDLVAVWTGGRIPYDPALMSMLLVFLLSQGIWSFSALLLTSSNNHRVVALWRLAATGAGLALAYPMGSRWGAPGIVAGMVVADVALGALPILEAACRLLGQNFRGFVIDVPVRGLAVLGVMYLALHSLAWLSPGGRVLQRLGIAAITAGLTGVAAAYALWLSPAEKKGVRTFVVDLGLGRLSSADTAAPAPAETIG